MVIGGTALAEQGNYEGAIKQYKIAVGLDPDYAQAFYNWSMVLANLGDCEGAAKMYQRAREIDNESYAAQLLEIPYGPWVTTELQS